MTKIIFVKHTLKVCLDITYLLKTENWKLKTYCWKHYSKIIFKYVNSTVGPKNALVCVFLHFWLGCEQCRGTQPKTQTLKTHTGRYANTHLGLWTVPWDPTKNANAKNTHWPLCKHTLRVYLDTAYFTEIENLLLKVL